MVVPLGIEGSSLPPVDRRRLDTTVPRGSATDCLTCRVPSWLSNPRPRFSRLSKSILECSQGAQGASERPPRTTAYAIVRPFCMAGCRCRAAWLPGCLSIGPSTTWFAQNSESCCQSLPWASPRLRTAGLRNVAVGLHKPKDPRAVAIGKGGMRLRPIKVQVDLLAKRLRCILNQHPCNPTPTVSLPWNA